MRKTVYKLVALALMIGLLGTFSSFAKPCNAAFSGDDRIVIVLDPGHGGVGETGTCRGEKPEKQYTLALALKLKQLLEANGSFRVFITRTSDVNMSIAARGIYANSVNADLLFSIHFNGETDTSKNGASAWNSVFSEYSPDRLSSMILSNISALGFASEGVYHREDTTGFYWNSERQWDVKDPSLGILSDYYGVPTWGCKFGYQGIIVEHGYFTNDHDAALIFSSGMIDKLAKADADAIIAYYTNHTHSYEGSARQDFPSNCVFNGKQSVHCTVCRHRKNVTELPAAPDNHYYYVSSVQKAATCETDGAVTYSCYISDGLNEKKYYCPSHDKVEVTQKATGHDYKVTFRQELTHTENGVTTYTCSKCGKSYSDIKYAEGHTWEYVSYKEPTCTESGGTLYKCHKCGEEKTNVEEALGHAYRRVELLEEPTCTEKGKESVICTRCEYETELDIDPLGHMRELLEHKDPTCEEKGYDNLYCERCDEEYFEYAEALGHKYEVTEKVEVSCSNEGKTVYKCSVCSDTYTETKEKLPHKLDQTDFSEPTCESKGVVTFVCTVCQAVEKEYTDAIGHDYDEGEVTKKAGFLISGILTHTCRNDSSHKSDEVIPSFASTHKKLCIISAASLSVLIALTVLAIIFRKAVASLFKKIFRKKKAEETKALSDGGLEDASEGSKEEASTENESVTEESDAECENSTEADGKSSEGSESADEKSSELKEAPDEAESKV